MKEELLIQSTKKRAMRPTGMRGVFLLVLFSLVMWTGSHSMLNGMSRKERSVDTPILPIATPAPYKPWLNRKKYTIRDSGVLKPIKEKGVGLVTFVGNDKYVDGALVLGYSAGKTSACGEGKWCRTGALVSPKIAAGNTLRLRKVFDDIILVNKSLAHTVAKTPWGTTFDKFYLWSLVRYQVIIFYDADMVLTSSSTDLLRSIKLPDDHYWIAALGSSKGYFATGTMVMRPDAGIMADLVRFYDAVRTNKTDRWGFRGPNARDGLVMRYFISGRVVSIKSLPADHLSGSWKPWYNSHGDQSEVKDLAKFLKDTPKQNKPATARWWRSYEAMHKAVFVGDSEETAAWGNKWGGVVTPQTHVWMLRGTKWEYTQELGGWG
eukprot:TRINITY_DN9794_c1_g1_i1.p1 TRINITY_DN9794_c1_g1~~TRINITY_DN9794_c1_g1_i1.p1  ORF type:complete len:378 (+),score=69.38 TRINITY_DN9794_c1_g1_i1:37-1170(+)